MLSKCANPACSAKFQYLHLGKLFAIEYRNCSAKYTDAGSSELAQKRECLRYFWLCSACCQSFTLQVSRAGRVRIAPVASADDPDQSGASEGLSEEGELISRANRARERNMRNVKRTLDALVKELEFLECGGYRQPMGWVPALIFEDSPICPRHSFSSCPNAECVLLEFVPVEWRKQSIPCRHIPLNESGESLHTLYKGTSMEETTGRLRMWLKKSIVELERAVQSQPVLQKETLIASFQLRLTDSELSAPAHGRRVKCP